MKYTLIAFAIALTALTSTAQNAGYRFAVKASAEFGLGNSLSSSSSIASMSSKATSANYGIDFGWTFWTQQNHSLELNAGFAYSPTSVKLDLSSYDYNYAAPASADIDEVPYQRYYELDNVYQKVSYDQISIPLYVSYSYQCNSWLGLHGDLGMRFGFKTSAKINEVGGESFSYGVYPQYNDLLINDPYMNDFGYTNLADAKRSEVTSNAFSTSILIGLGTEFRISRHFSADLSLRYNPGLTNLFKNEYSAVSVTNESALVNYSNNVGQQIKALSNYLSSSKLSQISLRIGIVYRF